MCLSYPMRVERVHDDGTATVTDRGTLRRVPLVVVNDGGQDVATGDWLLVSCGLAVARVSATEATATLAMLENVEADQ